MNKDSPIKAIIVVTSTALVCSILVTLAAVKLQPIQRAYQDLERNRFLVGLSGMSNSTIDLSDLSDREVIAMFQALDARIVDLDVGAFDKTYNADTFDTFKAAADPELSVAIPEAMDAAKLGRRSQLQTVYLVRDKDKLQRIIFPIYGQGMWSTIYGFIALEADLNTIAGIAFYEQAETAGIGDKILRPDWQAGWRGRRLYDDSGTLRFRIGGSRVDPASLAARYQVDAITGASVTADAVTNMVGYWFGPHGFAPFLEFYRSQESR